MQTYDYIVVGAGTAGCVLASRLTEDPSRSVLLVEAGTSRTDSTITNPPAWLRLFRSGYDWGFVTTPQASGGALVYPRGRLLGGSSGINGMVHLRGGPSSYDGWSQVAGPGWSYQGLLPYFRCSEHADGRDPVLRGQSGPMRVAPAVDRHPVAEAFVAAVKEDGHPFTEDANGRHHDGVGWVDLNIVAGRRQSAADGYLLPVLDRPNLSVLSDAAVTALTMRGDRCVGVEYLVGGRAERARADSEVVLTAGAIGSPQILMLSGIGPAAHLQELGVTVVADVTGVGENLHDHPVGVVTCATSHALPMSRYNHIEAVASVRSGIAGNAADIQLYPVTVPLVPPGHEAPQAAFAICAAVLAPHSRGSVRLASNSVLDAPVIDPNLLADERDVDALAAGMLIAQRVAAASPFDAIGGSRVLPVDGERSGTGLRSYLRRSVATVFHPVGTCRMGGDDSAVVDPELRVRGVTGLRVADAAVIPSIPDANTNATVLAIAEKAASLILAG